MSLVNLFNNDSLKSLINISLKALMLLGKFVLIFFMARFFSPSELGQYGLVVVITMSALYAVGFDFYIFSTRDLASKDKKTWSTYLRSQGAFILLTYLIVLPIILLLVSKTLGKEWLVLVGFLIVTEHLNQELMRLFIIDGQVLLATFLQFLRSGLWCYLIILLMTLSIINIELINVIYAWLISSIFSLAIAMIYLFKTIVWDKSSSINWQWILKGLKVCIPFLCATLAMKGINTLDRVWLESASGLEVVGVYTLFFSLTGVLIAFLESGVFAFIYPEMIKRKDDPKIFTTLVIKMIKQVILLLVIMSSALTLILPFFLKWIGKSVYTESISMFYILLLGNIMLCLSMIPHYILYSYQKDKSIIVSHILSLITFIVLARAFIYFDITNHVVLAVTTSLTILFLIKLLFTALLYYDLNMFKYFNHSEKI